MGDWFQTIADIDATPEEADELAAAVLDRLIERGIIAAEDGEDGHAPGDIHSCPPAGDRPG